MNGKLLFKVNQGEKRVGIIEPLLVLPVAALHLAVVPWGIGPNELMMDPQFSGSSLKESWKISFAVGKTVGKLKAVIRLDTLHMDPSSGIPLDQFFQEVRRGVGRLLWIGSQKTEPGELVNGGILKQAQLWHCNTL